MCLMLKINSALGGTLVKNNLAPSSTMLKNYSANIEMFKKLIKCSKG